MMFLKQVYSNDSDNNGRINSNDTGFADANNNGMDDASESNIPTDTDSDFIFDYLELDSDADGCFDVVKLDYWWRFGWLLRNSPVTVGIDGTVTSGSDGYDSPNTNTSFNLQYNFLTTDSGLWKYYMNGQHIPQWFLQWTSQGGTGCDSVATLNLTVLADSVILSASDSSIVAGIKLH